MLRWLPERLLRLYRRLLDARPYARPRRAPALPEPVAAAGGRDRQFRLEIVQDAFCHHRPEPRKLFRRPQAPRDTVSWCEEPNPHAIKHRGYRPRCAACERSWRLFVAANHGDRDAEHRLYHDARRGAVRLLAERRYYRWDRHRHLDAVRYERALNGPKPMPDNCSAHEWEMYRQRGSVSGHHVRDRAEVERALVRAHAEYLRVQTQRRRARLTDLQTTRREPEAIIVPDSVRIPDTAPAAPRPARSPRTPVPNRAPRRARPTRAQAVAQPASTTTAAATDVNAAAATAVGGERVSLAPGHATPAPHPVAGRIVSSAGIATGAADTARHAADIHARRVDAGAAAPVHPVLPPPTPLTPTVTPAATPSPTPPAPTASAPQPDAPASARTLTRAQLLYLSSLMAR